MEELDLLKKDWKKKEHSYSQISESEIYRMLHHKSSSIVKWILIISIIEVILWTAINTIYSTDDLLKSLGHEELLIYFRIQTYLSFAIVVVFIYLFYKNYVNISTTSSTAQLMKDILKTRKTVKYYVWYNLFLIGLSIISSFMLVLAYNPGAAALRDGMQHQTKYVFLIIAMVIGTILVSVGVFWLFYRLLYGILLKKLLSNYKVLKTLEF